MKIKSLLLTTLFAFGFLIVSAQTPTFEKGDKVLNLGIGFGGYGTLGYRVALPPVSASFEVGILDGILDKGTIGVGGYLAFASYKQRGYIGDSYWSYSRFVIGPRGTFHYPLVDKLDTYGGLMLGFSKKTWKWNGSSTHGDDPGGSGIGFALFGGARYYFTDQLAAMAELGFGISYLNIGVALKF